MAFTCPSVLCGGRSFKQKCHLLRHLRNQHNNLWCCVRCKKQFSRYDNYTYHERVCQFKATGKRINTDENQGSSTKKSEHNLFVNQKQT